MFRFSKKKHRLHFFEALLFSILLTVVFASCTARNLDDAEQLLAISLEDPRRLVNDLASNSRLSPQDRVAIVEQLVQRMKSSPSRWVLPSFLGSYTLRFPTDPYNPYYLFLAGNYYEEVGERPLSSVYYHRVLFNPNDIVIEGASVQLQAIQRLLLFAPEAISRIDLYTEMLGRFTDQIDRGSAWYFLGRAYEEAGLYQKSFAAYAKFLDYPKTVIPGKINEQQRIRELISLSGTTIDWSRESLDQLLSEVRSALNQKNFDNLTALQAKVNFFSMSWLQEKADFNSQVSYDLRRFVQDSSTIYAETTLEGNSNSQEAYLKTWGWSTYMPIWYLYFRRVNFPAAPEVHGNWEWVGIYFGNSLQ